MILVLISVVAFLVFVVLAFANRPDAEPWLTFAMVAIICLIISGFIWMITYSCSVESYAAIRAYTEILEETPEVVIMIQRAITAEDYQMELTDLLHTYKVYNNYWFIRQWIARTPDDIRAMFPE